MIESTISVVDPKVLLSIFGARDQHLRRVREALGVKITARDDQVRIQGEQEAVKQATEVLEELRDLAHQAGAVRSQHVTDVLARVTGLELPAEKHPMIELSFAGRSIEPKSSGQAQFIQEIAEKDLVFCIGPAGTGKTYLSVAMAVAALKQERVRKIVLVRPAVDAGESLGFLPGDLRAKIHPYLRPLLDALREMLDYEQFKRYSEQDLIEVLPLAYMRGRTLNEAFIILDEAQNTTVPQMKMFLTRMGRGSKIVVVGDVTQVDLPSAKKSGLIDALERLKGVDGMATCALTKADIVRHPLVEAIVQAYEMGE